MKTKLFITASLAMLLAAPAAYADLVSFAYDNFQAQFNGTTFSIDFKTNSGGHAILVPTQEKTFTDWSLGNIGSSDIDTTLTITNVTGSTVGSTALASGAFSWVDIDGDQITAELNGTWTLLDASDRVATFGGTLSNITINKSGDGLFEGTDGNSFSLDFAIYGSPPNALTGWVVHLETNGWFDVEFSDANTRVSGALSVVPAPGAALLVGLGVMAVGWVRRRIA